MTTRPPSPSDPAGTPPPRPPVTGTGAASGVESTAPAARPMVPAEPRGERIRRKGHKAVLYLWSGLLVVFAFLLVVLTLANRGEAELNGVVGSTTAPIALIVLGAGAIGWVLGIATAALFARRTRSH